MAAEEAKALDENLTKLKEERANLKKIKNEINNSEGLVDRFIDKHGFESGQISKRVESFNKMAIMILKNQISNVETDKQKILFDLSEAVVKLNTLVEVLDIMKEGNLNKNVQLHEELKKQNQLLKDEPGRQADILPGAYKIALQLIQENAECSCVDVLTAKINKDLTSISKTDPLSEELMIELLKL